VHKLCLHESLSQTSDNALWYTPVAQQVTADPLEQKSAVNLCHTDAYPHADNLWAAYCYTNQEATCSKISAAHRFTLNTLCVPSCPFLALYHPTEGSRHLCCGRCPASIPCLQQQGCRQAQSSSPRAGSYAVHTVRILACILGYSKYYLHILLENDQLATRLSHQIFPDLPANQWHCSITLHFCQASVVEPMRGLGLNVEGLGDGRPHHWTPPNLAIKEE